MGEEGSIKILWLRCGLVLGTIPCEMDMKRDDTSDLFAEVAMEIVIIQKPMMFDMVLDEQRIWGSSSLAYEIV